MKFTLQNTRLVFFDLDGTLTPSNCLHQLYIIKRQYLNGAKRFFWTLRFYLQLPLFFLLYKISSGYFNRYYYAQFAGMELKRLRVIIEQHVAPFLGQNIYPQARRVIMQNKKQGYRIVLVSASWVEIVANIACQLDIDDCLATRLEIAAGRLTGKIKQLVDHEEKSRQIQQYITRHKLPIEHSVGYGNSHYDIPMLKLAQTRHVINPSRSLRLWAEKNNTTCLNWRMP